MFKTSYYNIYYSKYDTVLSVFSLSIFALFFHLYVCFSCLNLSFWCILGPAYPQHLCPPRAPLQLPSNSLLSLIPIIKYSIPTLIYIRSISLSISFIMFLFFKGLSSTLASAHDWWSSTAYRYTARRLSISLSSYRLLSLQWLYRL